jgi:outer membrane protein assembly factor BamB
LRLTFLLISGLLSDLFWLYEYPQSCIAALVKSIIISICFAGILVSCFRSTLPDTESGAEENQPGKYLLDQWPREGPELLWIYEGLGKGYGGPAISSDGIFINAEEEDKSYIVCLDHNGTFRWRIPNGTEFVGTDFTASYPGSRSAPTLKEHYVYAISGTGSMSCVNGRKGELIWTVDLVRDFQGIPGDFGYSESPVADEKKIYFHAAGKTLNLVALDRHTGELVWSSPLNRDDFSYSTPVLISRQDRDLLVGTSRNFIHVVDRKDGTLLSSYRLEGIRRGYEHCNSVVFKEGHVYFVASEDQGQGSVKLHLSQDGQSLNEIWRNSEVMNVFGGFVVVENLLYTTLENKKLVGLDTESGRILHSARSASGSIVYADQKLFVYGHNGTLQLFTLEDGTPSLQSEIRIRKGSGQHFSFPVINEGVMYIRRGNALMAYAVR